METSADIIIACFYFKLFIENELVYLLSQYISKVDRESIAQAHISGKMNDWLTDWLIDWLIDCFIDNWWLYDNWIVNWFLIDWIADWQRDWLAVWSSDRSLN